MTNLSLNSLGFPPELLERSAAERLAYFQGKIVAHPHLKQAHLALLNAIRQPGDASLVLVFGPTGVGKTTLRLRIEQQLCEDLRNAVEPEPGRVGVASMEVVSPDSGDFRWKDYYLRALKALDDPFLEQRIDYRVRNIRRSGDGELVVGPHVSIADMRRALEQALYYRRPMAFLMDEAQHLKKIAGGRRLLDQMDVLKSLASLTGIVHVLIGTYDLLGLANLSAQLNRRSIEIHFPRYHAENSHEWSIFQSALLTFQRHLPLAKEPDLVGYSEFIYERSVGCIGILKSWLGRALAAALEKSADTLTIQHLERSAEPLRKLLRMAREIQEGENTLVEQASQQAELHRLLGMPQKSERTNDYKTSKSVGKRKPVRDPIGSSDHVP